MRERRLGALIAGLGVLASSGCTTADYLCRGDYLVWGLNPGEGHYLAPDVWESSPIDGRWVDLAPARYIEMRMPRWELEGRPIIEMHGYLSETPDGPCNDGGCEGRFAEVTGNGVQFRWADRFGKLVIANGTCAKYYIRVLVTAGRPTLAGDAGPLPLSFSP